MFVYRVIRDASFKKWPSTGPRPTLRVNFLLYYNIMRNFGLLYHSDTKGTWSGDLSAGVKTI